jgi:lysophospholipase L1-like esterase
MKLLTVGDSFTYGEELNNLTDSWPNILANRIQYKLTNLSKPGGGNSSMVRHCIEQINNYDMVIIAWSHYARIEFADEYGVYDIWPGCCGLAFSNQIKYRKELINYIDKHHNDSYLYQQYLCNIILLQSYLKSNQKRYIMLDSFGNNQTSERKNYTNLTEQIDKTYFVGWPSKSMMEWTYGCPQGPNGHFLEQGHQRVADKIYEHIRNLSWVS